MERGFVSHRENLSFRGLRFILPSAVKADRFGHSALFMAPGPSQHNLRLVLQRTFFVITRTLSCGGALGHWPRIHKRRATPWFPQVQTIGEANGLKPASEGQRPGSQGPKGLEALIGR